MNMTRLDEIGDALERATAAQLASPASSAAPARRRRRMPSRRFVLVAAALAIVIPGGAVAATVLISNNDTVAQSIPAGTLSLVGTQPTCTTVTAGVEFHCTLAKVPSAYGGAEPGQWKGTVEPTVDATKHVNGGCRALSDDGREWECYIGQAAVTQKIISEGFLGEKSFGPGVG
jgi:hypothetical protein